MNVVVAIFIYGCFVTSIVAIGLVFAMSALAPDGPGEYEGKSAEEKTR